MWIAVRLVRSVRIVVLATALATIPHTLLAQEQEPKPPAPPDEQAAPVGYQLRDRIDRIRQYFTDKGLVDLLLGDGFYLQFHGLTPGGGLRAGAGYRHTLSNQYWRYDVVGAVSVRGYRAFESGLWWRPLASGALEIGGHLHDRVFTREKFFGVGPASRREDETSYRISAVQPFASMTARPTRWIEIGARTGPREDHLGPGEDSNHPSIEQRFSEDTVPGIGRQIRFLYSEVRAQVDLRDRPDHAPVGGAYAVTFERYADRDGGRFSTSRLIAEAAQDVPLAGPDHLLVLHVLAATTLADAGARVPFYLLPDAGGSDTLRAFDSWRFRDRNALVLNAEYRYRAAPLLELAAFADYGAVGPEWRTISRSRMKPSYGVGVRGRTERRVILRFDVATGGGEGLHAMVTVGPAF